MLTKEQINFITTSNDTDTQTGLPEPEHTIQVIRSLNTTLNEMFDIDYEQLIIEQSDSYVVRFNTIGEMFEYVANTIG